MYCFALFRLIEQTQDLRSIDPTCRCEERVARHMKWRVCLLAVAAVAGAHGFDVEGGASKPGLRPSAPGAGPPLAQQQGGDRPAVQGGGIQGQIGGAKAKMSKWYRTYQSFVAAAAKVSQLISFCCGVWLVLSMPLSLVASSIMLRFDEAFLIVYLALYGVLMLGMELPLGAVQRVLQQYFFFAYTRPGRGAFVVHVAIVAWACKHVRSSSLPRHWPADAKPRALAARCSAIACLLAAHPLPTPPSQ